MIKTILQQFLKIHQRLPNIQPIKQDFHNYCRLYPTSINNLTLLNHSTMKFKEIFRMLTNLNPNQIYAAIFISLSFQLYYYQNTLMDYYIRIQQNQEQKKEIKPKITLNDIVIREVLQKQQILDMLADLIVRLDQKQSTQHNVSKQLNKIYQNNTLYEKTYKLTKDLVIDQVFNSQDIYVKLRQLILKVLNDQKIPITTLLVNTIKDNAPNHANQGLANLFNQQDFQQGLANAMAGAAFSMLDDQNNVKEIIKALQDQ